MKILLLVAVVQALNLVAFAWFNRTAVLRILVLRQQLAVYKRRSAALSGALVRRPVPSRQPPDVMSVEGAWTLFIAK